LSIQEAVTAEQTACSKAQKKRRKRKAVTDQKRVKYIYHEGSKKVPWKACVPVKDPQTQKTKPKAIGYYLTQEEAIEAQKNWHL
jgi:hypothetical protein